MLFTTFPLLHFHKVMTFRIFNKNWCESKFYAESAHTFLNNSPLLHFHDDLLIKISEKKKCQETLKNPFLSFHLSWDYSNDRSECWTQKMTFLWLFQHYPCYYYTFKRTFMFLLSSCTRKTEMFILNAKYSQIIKAVPMKNPHTDKRMKLIV